MTNATTRRTLNLRADLVRETYTRSLEAAREEARKDDRR